MSALGEFLHGRIETAKELPYLQGDPTVILPEPYSQTERCGLSPNVAAGPTRVSGTTLDGTYRNERADGRKLQQETTPCKSPTQVASVTRHIVEMAHLHSARVRRVEHCSLQRRVVPASQARRVRPKLIFPPAGPVAIAIEAVPNRGYLAHDGAVAMRSARATGIGTTSRHDLCMCASRLGADGGSVVPALRVNQSMR